MPADVLTTPSPTAEVREEKTAPIVGPHSEVPAASGAPKSLLDQFRESQAQARQELFDLFGPRLEQGRKDVEEARRREAEVASQILIPSAQRMISASQVPPPPAQQMLPQPPVPSQAIRPFMDVESKNALQGVVQTLGLMAQMAMAGKSPVGALSALTGAMNGWFEGDRERANRQWREYLGQVDRIREENASSLANWKMAAEQWGMNETGARAQFIVAEAEAKRTERATDAANQRMHDTYQQLQQQMALSERTANDSAKLMMAVVADERRREEFAIQEQRHRDQMAQQAREFFSRLDAQMQHQREMENIARDNQDIRRSLASQKQQEKDQGYQVMSKVLQDMDGMVDRLDSKGMLPKKGDLGSTGKAWMARKINPNDEDWRQWLALQGAMVGFERQVYNDKGARALAVYESLLKFVDSPPTAEGAHAVIKRMQGYIGPPPSGAAAAPVNADFIFNQATGKLEPVKR